MSRQEAAWLAIRVLGFYLLLQAVLSLISALPMVFRMAALESDFGGEASDSLQSLMNFSLVESWLQLLLSGAVGFYLLFRGRRVFDWITRMERA
jgi:hypothetical protein